MAIWLGSLLKPTAKRQLEKSQHKFGIKQNEGIIVNFISCNNDIINVFIH